MLKISSVLAIVTTAATMIPVAAHATLISILTGGQRPRPRPPVASVPEIDASMGLLALAAVAAALAFVWERNRRMAR